MKSFRALLSLISFVYCSIESWTNIPDNYLDILEFKFNRLSIYLDENKNNQSYHNYLVLMKLYTFVELHYLYLLKNAASKQVNSFFHIKSEKEGCWCLKYNVFSITVGEIKKILLKDKIKLKYVNKLREDLNKRRNTGISETSFCESKDDLFNINHVQIYFFLCECQPTRVDFFAFFDYDEIKHLFFYRELPHLKIEFINDKLRINDFDDLNRILDRRGVLRIYDFKEFIEYEKNPDDFYNKNSTDVVDLRRLIG